MDIEEIGKAIVNSAVKVHRALGPGLLESAYQKCLKYELERYGHVVKCELPISILYDEIEIDVGFRADMLVDDSVIVENKTVERIAPIHQAQLLTYLKLSKIHLGFLLNWNVQLMKSGIKRMVNNLAE